MNYINKNEKKMDFISKILIIKNKEILEDILFLPNLSYYQKIDFYDNIYLKYKKYCPYEIWQKIIYKDQSTELIRLTTIISEKYIYEYLKK